MIFTDEKGQEFRFEQGGLNVSRSSFDLWLTKQAASSGAEVRDNASAISCEEQADFVAVTLRGDSVYTENARFVIDCEGVTGVLKRKVLYGTSMELCGADGRYVFRNDYLNKKWRTRHGRALSFIFSCCLDKMEPFYQIIVL